MATRPSLPARSAAPTSTFNTAVLFESNGHDTVVSIDLTGSESRFFKAYAASADPHPSEDTEPVASAVLPPPGGQLVGDGAYAVDRAYTVQLTYRDATGAPHVRTGHVPAESAIPGNRVDIVLS